MIFFSAVALFPVLSNVLLIFVTIWVWWLFSRAFFFAAQWRIVYNFGTDVLQFALLYRTAQRRGSWLANAVHNFITPFSNPTKNFLGFIYLVRSLFRSAGPISKCRTFLEVPGISCGGGQISKCRVYLEVPGLFRSIGSIPKCRHISKWWPFSKCRTFLEVPGVFRSTGYILKYWTYSEVPGLFRSIGYILKFWTYSKVPGLFRSADLFQSGDFLEMPNRSGSAGSISKCRTYLEVPDLF